MSLHTIIQAQSIIEKIKGPLKKKQQFTKVLKQKKKKSNSSHYSHNIILGAWFHIYCTTKNKSAQKEKNEVKDFEQNLSKSYISALPRNPGSLDKK